MVEGVRGFGQSVGLPLPPRGRGGGCGGAGRRSSRRTVLRLGGQWRVGRQVAVTGAWPYGGVGPGEAPGGGRAEGAAVGGVGGVAEDRPLAREVEEGVGFGLH